MAAGPKALTWERSALTRETSRSSRTWISRRISCCSRETSSRCTVIGRIGSASTGRERSCATPRRSRSTHPRRAAAIRPRASAMRSYSMATSGTTRLAASVGVAARTSATLSSTGLSGSWPMAETTGVCAAATARCNASSEKGSRSSTEPPPRAMMMTSTSGSTSRSCNASITCATVPVPCTAVLMTRNCTAGHRSCDTASTSRSAAEPRPVISPTFLGKKGSGFLRAGSVSPSAVSCLRKASMRARSSPMPTWRISVVHKLKVPRPA